MTSKSSKNCALEGCGTGGKMCGDCFGGGAEKPVPPVQTAKTETVNHPQHYNTIGIECIDVVENFNFNRGNAIKYIWRAGLKGDALEDLRKSRWYLDREIERLEKRQNGNHK